MGHIIHILRSLTVMLVYTSIQVNSFKLTSSLSKNFMTILNMRSPISQRKEMTDVTSHGHKAISHMPLVGFGTWKIPNEKTADTVYEAINVGLRLRKET